MPCTANGLYVVQGEMAILLAAMRRGNRWSSHSSQDLSQDVLIQSFNDLKDVLNQIGDLRDLDPNHYFDPFLEVIRAGETTGPITSLALSSVHKFLSYGLIEGSNKSVPGTLENIADAVTHAKFVSIDENSDGVVLMKILQVLRTLVLSPLGSMLTNESMCEIMLSCFRICFEHRLTEHLRKSAEFCLKDLVQHLFSQLPEFSEDSRHIKKLKISKGSVDSSSAKQKRKSKTQIKSKESEKLKENQSKSEKNETIEPSQKPADKILDMQGDIHQEYKSHQNDLNRSMSSEEPESATETKTSKEGNAVGSDEPEASSSCVIEVESSESQVTGETENGPKEGGETEKGETVAPAQDYINPQGVRFTSDELENENKLHPYGLGCIRELFRFLISLINPSDKHNTEMMIHLGLTLLGVAFEVGADAVGKHATLLVMVKDELCRNLFSVSWVETNATTVVARASLIAEAMGF